MVVQGFDETILRVVKVTARQDIGCELVSRESITDWRENLSLSLISLTIGSWLSENKNKDNKEESKSQ